MAKKYKSNKLIKKDDQPVDKPASAFGNFATMKTQHFYFEN